MRKLRRTLGGFFRKLKYGFQRARRGYCDKDLWEIDTWFLTLLPRMLRQLAQDANGYPFQIKKDYIAAHPDEYAGGRKRYEDTPEFHAKMTAEEYLYCYHEDSEAHHEACLRLWRETLERMALLLSEAGRIRGVSGTSARAYGDQCLRDGLALFVKHFEDLWD